ncbi:MAG: redoxin domain-containing protein [Elusimicrobiales bacterium]|nr:redoxin domain-containing protein [Elusimicrobiales bacterium]
MKKILFIFVGVSLMACSGPVAERTKIAQKGKLAPPVSFSKVISGGMSSIKGWEDFKGKAVVMEFWFTDCKPCVENIPHFNNLIEKFKGKPVAFLSITGDSADTVKKFMKTHEMKGLVAVEVDAEINKKFKIRGVPSTVLINRKGEVASFTYPSMVTEKTINNLIAGGKIVASRELMSTCSAPASKASFSISASSGAPSFSSSDTRFEAKGISLSQSISYLMNDVAHGVEYKNVSKEQQSEKYNILSSIKFIKGSDNKVRLREFVIAGIKGSLPLRISLSNENKEVYLLKKNGKSKSGLVAKSSGSSSCSTSSSDKEMSIEGTGVPIVRLAKVLEKWLKVPVLNETGLTGGYSYKFKTKVSDVKSINKALTEELGLKLIKSHSNVTMAKVEGIKFASKKKISHK